MSFRPSCATQDISTTQRSYIKMARPDVAAAMKQFEARIACAAGRVAQLTIRR
jgi:hypothetical protein